MEYLDIVDLNNVVVGSATRKEVYEARYPHRIVHVLVFNSKRELLMQRRAAHKDYMPLSWGTSAGGHVQKGETYERAAAREYQEELGVLSQIRLIGEDKYIDSSRGFVKFIRSFYALHHGPFEILEDELDGVDFFGISEVSRRIDAGESFQPELLFLLDRYFGM